jgi:alpha-galactosidase
MYRVTRAGTLAAAPGAGSFAVSDLAWLASSNGWGPAERDRANGEQAAGDGPAISVGGVGFAKGIGVHADSAVHVYLGRNCRTFTAQVGVDAEVGANGAVRFAVYGDGRLLAYTGVRSGGQAPVRLSASVGGVLALELRVTDARNTINYDHASWGAPTLVCGTSGTGSYVSDRSWSASSNGWGAAERDQSNGEQTTQDGSVLTVGAVSYPRGVGTHAASDISVPIACSRFTAVVGIDAETAGRGSVVFSVLGDGVTLYTSPVVTSSTGGVLVDVATAGRSTLRLVVSNGGDSVDYDHANWADARLIC